MHTWDPERYLTYADERGRPFVELVARVGAADPDIGRRPRLRARQPDRAARRALARRARRRSRLQRRDDRQGAGDDAGRGSSRSPTCATGSDGRGRPRSTSWSRNATLQWVPGHLDLLPGARRHGCTAGGWLAFQVPGNFGEPSHTIRTELAAEAPYADPHGGRRRPELARPGRLPRGAAATRLRGRRLGDDLPPRARGRGPRVHLGLRHRRAADPAGTAGRPAARASRSEFKRRLRAAYPAQPSGEVVLPFRRIFVVARVA